MEKITALLVSVLMAFVALLYCYFMFFGIIEPVFATWLLFALATAISMWTYLKSNSGEKSIITNIANATDVLATWSIFIFLVFFGKNIRYVFTQFEIFCVIISIAILFFWKISKKSEIANLMINALLVVGYIPLIIHLCNSKINTEPFFVWLLVLASQLIATYNPIKKRKKLAIIYAIRGVVSAGTVVFLIIRIMILY